MLLHTELSLGSQSWWTPAGTRTGPCCCSLLCAPMQLLRLNVLLSLCCRNSTSKESRYFIGTDQQVFTGFQPWSVCDRCDMPGEQVRIGLCYIHSHFLHIRYRRVNQTVASCGSGAVPRTIRRLIGGGGGGRLEFRSCQVTCPPGLPRPSDTISLFSFLGFR